MSPEQSEISNLAAAKLSRIYGAAALILGAEALAILGFLVWGLSLGQFRLLSADLTLVVLFLMAALWIGFAAWKIRAGARWARSSAIFWQVAQVLLAYDSVTGRGANWAIGVALTASAVVVLALLFSRPVIAAARQDQTQ